MTHGEFGVLTVLRPGDASVASVDWMLVFTNKRGSRAKDQRRVPIPVLSVLVLLSSST